VTHALGGGPAPRPADQTSREAGTASATDQSSSEASAPPGSRGRIVVDGRVFATEAADRGMGRHIEHVLSAIVAAGFDPVLLLPDSPRAGQFTPPPRARVRPVPPEPDATEFTTALNRLLVQEEAVAYVDATPFLPPMRYDVHACPVVAILYDLIPLRYPGDYLGDWSEGMLGPYANGLARVKKADAVLAISHVVRNQALRYLGIPLARSAVLEPQPSEHYERVTSLSAPGPDLFCIQGAHRSKSFPHAIPFLERLARRSGIAADVVVPTPTQLALIEAVRSDRSAPLRLRCNLPEADKVAMQSRSRAVAHLSIEEGYGIPLVEALLLDRPIVCLDTAINRELLGVTPGEESPPGVLLLDDASLSHPDTLERVARFLASPGIRDLRERRAALVDSHLARRARAPQVLALAVEAARRHFDAWHAGAGMAVSLPTEFGSCGVSDYCHALIRPGTTNRYALLLGPAPTTLQMLPHVRALPADLLPAVRRQTPGALFNLAVSKSLLRAFDAIASQSTGADALVVHDAGSYLPGILMDAAERERYDELFGRYLAGESAELRTMVQSWLGDRPAHGPEAERRFLEMDRAYRSAWLRSFRGTLVSHHPAFAERSEREESDAILELLHPESEIRRRARYAAMPIDGRANPGIVRFADKIRWALALGRSDVLVCSAGSVVRGKLLPVLARAVCEVNREWTRARRPARVVLMLAGRVLEPQVMEETKAAFESAGIADRLVRVHEPDETRFDAMLTASDVVVAFREQRRIQMSHSFVRALALGRPIVTNEGSGFARSTGVAVCREASLAEDLAGHLHTLAGDRAARHAYARRARLDFRENHSVESFFQALERFHG
jgi:glycosyltransferase involved in cell wall biosynthesis